MDPRFSEHELRLLMVKGLEGDGDAHRVLLTRLSSRLRGFFKSRLVRIGRGEVEAEDLVQEVLLAVHMRRHTYDPTQPLTPWVYAIARYKFLDYLRRTKVSKSAVSIDDIDLMAHDDVQAVESGIDLDKLLTEVSPKMQRAIRDVKLDGLSVTEAASRSGRSVSAVKVSVHRGLKTLERLIKRNR